MTTAGRPKILEALDAYGPRPVWRGRVHFLAALVAAPAAVVLFLVAPGPMAKVAVTIYAVSLVGLFAVSASYHRLAHTETAVKWFRRADHSMIFVLIAGSYTPFCLLVLPRVWGIPMLVVMWVTALAGIIMKMIRVTAAGGSSGSWLYVVMGWAAVITLPQLLSELGVARMSLLIIGGVMYTGGAIVLGKKWLNFSPSVFGYHEVWHALTVGAGACHFALVAMVVR